MQQPTSKSQLDRLSGIRPTRRRLLTLSLVSLGAAASAGATRAQGTARAPWQSQVEPLSTTEIIVGDQTLTVELAAHPGSRARGLGYRQGLAPGTGMLFVFPESAPRSFWMKGMRFCLDIIWIDAGEIIGASEQACPDPAGTADGDRMSFRSDGPAQYVLEVPGGWLDEHGLGAGTAVEIPDWVRSDD